MIYFHTEHDARGGIFEAQMSEENGQCRETVHVFAFGEWQRCHFADFDAALLGGADRQEYTRVMCKSAADKFWRKLNR